MSFEAEVQDLTNHINKLKENAVKKLIMSGVSPDRIAYYYQTDSFESGVILDQISKVGDPLTGTIAFRVNVDVAWNLGKDYISTEIQASWGKQWELLG